MKILVSDHNGHLSDDAVERYCLNGLGAEEQLQADLHLLTCDLCMDSVDQEDAFIEVVRRGLREIQDVQCTGPKDFTNN